MLTRRALLASPVVAAVADKRKGRRRLVMSDELDNGFLHPGENAIGRRNPLPMKIIEVYSDGFIRVRIGA